MRLAWLSSAEVQRSDVHNPTSAESKATADNRSNQLNPNNPAYQTSRGKKKHIPFRGGLRPARLSPGSVLLPPRRGWCPGACPSQSMLGKMEGSRLLYPPPVIVTVPGGSSTANETPADPETFPESAFACILTIVDEERDAVIRPFSLRETLMGERAYWVGWITSSDNDKRLAIVMTQARAKGQLAASDATRDLIARWKPSYFVVVGIAGGIAGRNGIELGDVVYHDSLEYYEPEKIVAGKRLRRPPQLQPPSPALLDTCRLVDGSPHRWYDSVLDRPVRPGGGPPRVFRGQVLSGEKLLGDLSSDVVQSVIAEFDQAIAVEMESAGVARALYEASAHSPTNFLVVRGISDFCNGEDNQQTRDVWRRPAAEAAAAFCKRVLEVAPTDPTAMALVQRSPLRRLDAGSAAATSGHARPTANVGRRSQFEEIGRRRWRELSMISYPAKDDGPDRKKKFMGSLLLHTYRAFQGRPFLRFTSLLVMTPHDHFGTLYSIVSPFDQMIRQLEASWMILFGLQKDGPDPKGYQDDLNNQLTQLNSIWTMRAEIRFQPQLRAFDTTYDPIARQITISDPEVESTNPGDYPFRLKRSSELMALVSALNEPGSILITEAEAVDTLYPLTKMVLAIMDGEFDLGRVRVGMENHEDWDYINNKADREFGLVD